MRKRAILFIAAAAAFICGGFALAAGASDFILFNATPSVRVGFYLRVHEAPARGRFVTVRARDVAPLAAQARNFTDESDRFIKRIAAMGGDHVCAVGDTLLINGEIAVDRAAIDSQGEPLAAWQGCRVLGPREALLLGDSESSFDGRYWGPIELGLIEGVWAPI